MNNRFEETYGEIIRGIDPFLPAQESHDFRIMIDRLRSLEEAANESKIRRRERSYQLMKGDHVVMHTCMEHDNPNNFGRIWTCRTDEKVSPSGARVVWLEGYSGCFATEFLQKVVLPEDISQRKIDWKKYDPTSREIESHKDHLVTNGHRILIAQHACVPGTGKYSWMINNTLIGWVTHFAKINWPEPGLCSACAAEEDRGDEVSYAE